MGTQAGAPAFKECCLYDLQVVHEVWWLLHQAVCVWWWLSGAVLGLLL